MELEYLKSVLGSLLIYWSRYLDQETANLSKVAFWFISQFATSNLLLPVYPHSFRGNPVKLLSALPKDTNELASLSSHYPSFMLNVKQGICEY